MPGKHRGGKGGFEPKLRVQERAARVAELSLRGRTQREIADVEGISQAAVSKILDRVADEHWQEVQRRLGRVISRQVSRTRHVYQRSIVAFEQSQTDQVRRRKRLTDRGGSGEAPGAGTVTNSIEQVTTPREGNPSFLGQALSAVRVERECIAPLVKKMGDKGPLQENEPPKHDLSRLSDEELRQHLAILRKTKISEAELESQEAAEDADEED